MGKNKVVLAGVPVETFFNRDEDGLICCVKGVEERYFPGRLEETLRKLEEEAKRSGFQVINEGEIFVHHNTRHTGSYMGYEHQRLQPSYMEIDFQDLFVRGKELRDKHKDADRIICIGPSHLSALVLYEENDFAARFDYHGDYYKSNKKCTSSGSSYASYMNAVEHRFHNITVVNYGVKEQEMDIFGKDCSDKDKGYQKANHFDIDLDVFDAKYEMNGCRVKSNFQVETLLNMLHETKPRKIGVWEYREWHDRKNNALEFMKSILAVPF
ncbi:MAG: hypothetical protein KKF46_03090 [Nanoarchaeota archaeon]|nr:hypothetical protein [Nanoarchaeota archaeon]MBU1321319.1 hypothetical protein [Nanoarchaeota archaeon]MBU1597526.1 hypothetical protein [Nanoarchaeota archaeon]MBU2441133.1 hypothetical protein [Nanoarchaeota archaeon]